MYGFIHLLGLWSQVTMKIEASARIVCLKEHQTKTHETAVPNLCPATS